MWIRKVHFVSQHVLVMLAIMIKITIAIYTYSATETPSASCTSPFLPLKHLPHHLILEDMR